jgi:hypothetical protein
MKKTLLITGIAVAVIMLLTTVGLPLMTREISISGTVGGLEAKVDFYTLGHIKKGGAVTVMMENVGEGFDSVTLFLVDMRSNFPVGSRGITTGERIQFSINSDSDYMLEVKGQLFKSSSYNGKIVIMN